MTSSTVSSEFRAQVVDEACAFNNLVGVDAKMINNNFLYAFCDIAHVGFLDLIYVLIRMPCDIPTLFKPAEPALAPLANPFNPALRSGSGCRARGPVRLHFRDD